LKLAAKAGCVGVFIGFETTSAEGLQEINKKFNIRKIKDIKQAVRRIHRYGMTVIGSFIMGLDVDKKGVGRETAVAAQRYGLDGLNVMFLTPLPGTGLWDDMKAKDRIILNDTPGDWRYFTLTFPVARFNHLTWSDMIAEKDVCYRTFYTYFKILQRVFNGIYQRRNPFPILFNNLIYRINTLRLDRKAYRKFDASPGDRVENIATNFAAHQDVFFNIADDLRCGCCYSGRDASPGPATQCLPAEYLPDLADLFLDLAGYLFDYALGF
jgi:radical SAM superfamily enzyme YgiQ (UPF0313 family)